MKSLRLHLAVGLVSLLSLGLLGLWNTPSAQAVSAGDWKAGNIIDDSIFYSGSDMSAIEVQQFLNARVPNCDTWGTEPSEHGGGTRAQYGAARGYPAPYTCLKDYSQNVPGYGADAYCGGISGGVKSAAQIIKEVSQACGIGSKVLIVLLQKEQSLVTDEWPFPNQYQKATGFACPDTAPCDAQYAGYFNQVYRAARQYKVYRANPGSYRYKARQNNAVLFNPNAGCGSSTVYLENDATTGLYTYTPYQPNQAALNNMYGTGDGCSAYGNRNFWRMYSDWFGSTRANTYSWQWQSQYAYTNASKTTPKDLNSLRLGEQVLVGFTARNTGNVTWTNSGANPVRVGTTNPTERHSSFDPFSGWIGPTRPAQLKESSVPPGGVGTFEFWLTANQAGSFTERFNLLAEGRAWFNDIGLSYGVRVLPDIYTWQWQSQYAYTNDAKTTPKDLNSLRLGERAYVGFTAKNTGNASWVNNGSSPLRVGTVEPRERSSNFSPFSGWVNNARPTVLKESVVPPGGVGTFEFWITGNQAGNFNERFGLVAEGKTWLNDPGLSYGIRVPEDIYSWQWQSQYAYTNDAKTTPKDLLQLSLGERAYVGFRAKNTGNVTWTNGGYHPLRVGTANPRERSSIFSPFSGWLSGTRPAVMKEASVAPGEIGSFEFWITGNQVGSFNERFGLLSEGRAWLNDPGLSYGIRVED